MSWVEAQKCIVWRNWRNCLLLYSSQWLDYNRQ